MQQQKMDSNRNNKNMEADEESEISHAFPTATGDKLVNAQVREAVKDNVFPKAKFLRPEDMPYSDEPASWCQQMASWCHIEPKNVQLWWQQTAKRSFQNELQHQRANKTNIIKREFFGKKLVCLVKGTAQSKFLVTQKANTQGFVSY